MGISAGLLNERLRVLKEIHVVSEYGDQDIQYKEKFWCRARHLDKEGTRTEINNEIFYTNNKQFEVRIYQDIKDTDIIQFYDLFYRIINISPDRPNQRKIITVELINSFDFPIDSEPIEDEVIPTPDPEPDPDFTPEGGRTFVYNGLEYIIIDESEAWAHGAYAVGSDWNDTYKVVVTRANFDNNYPGLTYSGNIVIPDYFVYNGCRFGVIGLSDDAFERTDIISVVIPNTVKKLNFRVPPLIYDPYSPDYVYYGAFNETYSLVSMKIYMNPHLGGNIIGFWFMFGTEVRTSVQAIYVPEENVDEYKAIFNNEKYDMSDKVYPIQN